MSDYGRVFHKSNLRRITLRGGTFGSTRHGTARRKRKTVHVSPGFTISPSYVNGHGITRESR